MLFSVVVPTHHRPDSLKRLLESLAAQSLDLSQFEVIVVPSPNDKSLPWLMNYARQAPFRLQVHIPHPDPHQGKSASFKRNQGVQRAAAEWIAFIDDDCEADTLWLATAAQHTQKTDLHGMEGATEIPVPPKRTFTYKGLRNLSTEGGYQTCNMFYRRATFLELGGFDLNFPFYLEDTDLAWTFLDHNKPIIFLEGAIVRHPVPAPEVKRLLENAKRVRLLPYLYKKHQEQFEHGHLRPLGKAQWIYLALYFGTLYSLWMSPNKLHSLIVLTIMMLVFHGAYVAYLLHDCDFEKEELTALLMYLPVTPLIALVQLIRGNIENRTFLIF